MDYKVYKHIKLNYISDKNMRQIRIIIAILLLRVLPTMVFESKKIRFFQNQVITKKTVDFPKGLICQDKPPGTPIKPLSPTDIIPNINVLLSISSHDLYGDIFLYLELGMW